jgi:hypothetical protein
VRTQVGVTIDPSPAKPLFDPRGARLMSAYRQLGEIAGHSIEFALDAAITPESRASFEDALVEAFENVARDFKDLEKADPAVHRYAVEKLTHIEIRYDGTRQRDDVKFDDVKQSLVIRGPAVRRALIERGVVYQSMLRVYDQVSAGRYDTATPDSIPVAERFEYFRWLTDQNYVRRYTVARSKSTDPDAEPKVILKMLRLAQLNSGKDAQLEAKARDWLVGRGSYFSQRYVHEPRAVMALSSDAVFNQAARAWAKWAIDTYPALDDDDRLRVARDLFIRSFTVDRALTHRQYPPFAWPGADLFAFGLREVDRWRASGHPTQLTTPRCSESLDFFVCSVAYDLKWHTALSARCNEDWYRFALETQGGRKRLVAAIRERKDPVFTETAFRNVSSSCERPIDTLLVMLRELEDDPADWTIGWTVLTEEYMNSTFDLAVLEETRRLWVTHPERRGALLALLVHMDRGQHGNVDWKGFASAFGTQIAANEFADYLAHDKLGFFDAYVAWPALGRGWSRAAFVVPHLDSWLAQASDRRLTYQNPYEALQKLLSAMCGEKSTKDLALMREYLEGRKRKHPGEVYASLIDSTREKECQPPPPPPPPRNEVKLSPLKEGLPPLRIIQTGAE